MDQKLQSQNTKHDELAQTVQVQHEAISALQTRVEEMEQKQQATSVHFGKWTTSKEDNDIQWNVVKQAPTLEGMISRMEDDNKKLVFGIAGLYRITYRWTSRENNNSSYRFGMLFLNDTVLAQSGSYNSNANGEMTEIMNIGVGDKIRCRCQSKSGSYQHDCGLTIERLGDCV